MIDLKIKKNISGFTIIEVLVACSIITISMFALMQTAQKGIILSRYALEKSQASLLLEEGAEAVKSIRDNNWAVIDGVNTNASYHLFFNTTTKLWLLDSSEIVLSGTIPMYPIDGVFDRTVTISNVSRDSNDNIVSTGGVIDSRTKKVLVTVTWSKGGVLNSKSLTFYVADIFN
jgi:type II secretory pathway pseudopilin PulG